MAKKPVVLMVLDGYGIKMKRQKEMLLQWQTHLLWTN